MPRSACRRRGLCRASAWPPRAVEAGAAGGRAGGMTLDMSRVKAVVFDMDDTLLNWRDAERGAIGQLALLHFAAHGVEERRVRTAYDAVMAENFAGWKARREWKYIDERLRILVDRLAMGDRLAVADLAQTFSREATARLAFLEG